MFPHPVLQRAQSLIECCVQRHVRMVFAESCTGGLIAAAVTAVPGASRVVDRGFVVYSYQSKEQVLGVPRAYCEQYGAVSEPVAIAMAEGALARAGGHAQLSVAVTGVAGPGGTPDKPEGLVHMASARLGLSQVLHEKHQFGDVGRDRVREETVLAALSLAKRCLDRGPTKSLEDSDFLP
jgi:nicotinamide-nucleotide amidase